MKTFAVVSLMLCATAAVLAAFSWAGSSEIRLYSADELAELSCVALGEQHEEVIFAYHDAEIAHHRKTGSFHDDLGIPPENVVPYAVLIKQYMRDNNISAAALEARSSPNPILASGFFHEITSVCATNPSWQATDAMQQAALNLGLIDG